MTATAERAGSSAVPRACCSRMAKTSAQRSAPSVVQSWSYPGSCTATKGNGWPPSERLSAADALHHPALLHADEAHTPGDLWDDGKEYEAAGMQLAAWLGSSQWWPRGW